MSVFQVCLSLSFRGVATVGILLSLPVSTEACVSQCFRCVSVTLLRVWPQWAYQCRQRGVSDSVSGVCLSLCFRGVATVDVPLGLLELNQCPQGFGVANAFKNTARCDYFSTFVSSLFSPSLSVDRCIYSGLLFNSLWSHLIHICRLCLFRFSAALLLCSCWLFYNFCLFSFLLYFLNP